MQLLAEIAGFNMLIEIAIESAIVGVLLEELEEQIHTLPVRCETLHSQKPYPLWRGARWFRGRR